MKPKVRFCELTSCFTLLVKWKKISYALKSFKHIFRNYWAHNTKETKTTFKTAFTMHNVRNARQCDHLPFGQPNIFVLLSPWVGFWVTYINNVCDVCQHFCLRHHCKFMNILCNMFRLNYRTMKKKAQLLQKLLMKTMIFLR